jgi:uncharacterized protein
MSDFRLQLAGLPEGRTRVSLSGRAAGLGLPAEEWPEALALDLVADRSGERFALSGRLAGAASVECARCLERFRLPLEAEFAALAERGGMGGDESAAGEDYLLAHDGRQVDLGDAVREQLLLALPMAALCRPDCAGLCARCGANRNAGPCACDVRPDR